MPFEILDKGKAINLNIATKQTSDAPKTFYFGAGWDNPNGPVDLDIVACLLGDDGKIRHEADLIYFNRKTAPGVRLSEDNTTGEGDGDDEHIVISTDQLPEDVTSVAVGLASYAGADFSNAPNPHFRACDGSTPDSSQIADVPAGAGNPGDTVLVAFRLDKTDAGWNLSNVGDFYAKGSGTDAIRGFAELFS